MKIILLRSGPSTILAAAFQSRFVATNEPLLLVALGSEGSQPEIAAGSKNCWPVLPADANGVDHGTGFLKAEISGLRLLHPHWCEDAGAASIASEWLRSGACFACGSGKRTTTFTALAGPSWGSHRRGISADQRSIGCHVIDARNQHWLLCELQADEKSEHCTMDADCPPSFPPSPGAGTVFADNAVFH